MSFSYPLFFFLDFFYTSEYFSFPFIVASWLLVLRNLDAFSYSSFSHSILFERVTSNKSLDVWIDLHFVFWCYFWSTLSFCQSKLCLTIRQYVFFPSLNWTIRQYCPVWNPSFLASFFVTSFLKILNTITSKILNYTFQNIQKFTHFKIFFKNFYSALQ